MYDDMTEAQIEELINRRIHQMLFHSCLYYRYGSSVWNDAEFDTRARELKYLVENYPKLVEKNRWGKYFADWDATTGYHLPLSLPQVYCRTQALKSYCESIGVVTE